MLGCGARTDGIRRIYESSRDDCLRIVLLNVGDRQLAEELVAEGFARVWMSWRKVRAHLGNGEVPARSRADLHGAASLSARV